MADRADHYDSLLQKRSGGKTMLDDDDGDEFDLEHVGLIAPSVQWPDNRIGRSGVVLSTESAELLAVFLLDTEDGPLTTDDNTTNALPR
jgi:hypothetical protein